MVDASSCSTFMLNKHFLMQAMFEKKAPVPHVPKSQPTETVEPMEVVDVWALLAPTSINLSRFPKRYWDSLRQP